MCESRPIVRKSNHIWRESIVLSVPGLTELVATNDLEDQATESLRECCNGDYSNAFFSCVEPAGDGLLAQGVVALAYRDLEIRLRLANDGVLHVEYYLLDNSERIVDPELLIQHCQPMIFLPSLGSELRN